MNNRDLKNIQTLFKCGYKTEGLVNVFPNGNITVLLYKENPTIGLIEGESKIQPRFFIFTMSEQQKETSTLVENTQLIVDQIMSVELQSKTTSKQEREARLDEGIKTFRETSKNWIDKNTAHVPLRYIDAIQKDIDASRELSEGMTKTKR